MKEQPKISIIIPIYNTEPYLDWALSSAVGQTLKDIEIICIDDGSTDQSNAILRKFAAEDSRIRCIEHSHNMGPSISRKQGILSATGKYIMFLDGDDALDVHACKKLFHKIEEEKCDIVQFGTEIVSNGSNSEAELTTLSQLLEPFRGRINANRFGDLTDICFCENKFGFTLWNKIYNCEVVQTAVQYYSDLRFNLSEDLYLFFLISFLSKSYVGIPDKYYYYRFGTGISTAHHVVDDNRFQNFVEQGTILQFLRAFAAEADPADVTGPSLDRIADRFASVVSYNWTYNGDSITRGDSLQYACGKFDRFEIISRILEMYYSAGYEKQYRTIERIRQSYEFQHVGEIKTIGVFYFRIRNGGIERVISELIPIWISKGYQVVLFTEEYPTRDDYPLPKQVKRIVLPPIITPNKKEIQARMQYLSKMLASYKVDTLVHNANVWKYSLIDILSAKMSGVSVVMHTHSFFAQGLKSQFSEDAYQLTRLFQIFNLCDTVVALSEVDRIWWGINHPHVYKMVNPLPFDLNKISPVDHETQTEIIWIGRISVEKQPLEALKIVKRVKEAGYPVKLQIVGQADDQMFYRYFVDSIQAMELSDVVHLNGFQRDVDPYYKKAGIFLCTSEFEGFMMTLTESKSYGIPAVLYDLPNLDLVRQRQGMIVVDQGDDYAAAQAIISLISDSKKRKAMGMEARQSVEALYSESIADKWERMFLDISNQQAAPEFNFKFHELQIEQKMLVDCLARGIQNRERYWMNRVSSGGGLQIPESDPKETTLQLYEAGEIGFAYIIKYAIAWLKYKLFRKKQ